FCRCLGSLLGSPPGSCRSLCRPGGRGASAAARCRSGALRGSLGGSIGDLAELDRAAHDALELSARPELRHGCLLDLDGLAGARVAPGPRGAIDLLEYTEAAEGDLLSLGNSALDGVEDRVDGGFGVPLVHAHTVADRVDKLGPVHVVPPLSSRPTLDPLRNLVVPCVGNNDLAPFFLLRRSDFGAAVRPLWATSATDPPRRRRSRRHARGSDRCRRGHS